MAFTNVDYNKDVMNYLDGNPYEAAFDRGVEKAKNIALEAMEKKKEKFYLEWSDHLENNMMPPDNASIIHNGKLDPGFYNVQNMSREKIWAEAKRQARAYGLGPHSINQMKKEIMADALSLKKHAVQKQYKMLRDHGNKVGDLQLQDLLDNEGAKFASFYQEYSDPYMMWDAPQKMRVERKQDYVETEGGYKYDARTNRIKETNWDPWNKNKEVQRDDKGRFIYGLIGTKEYIDMPSYHSPVLGEMNPDHPDHPLYGIMQMERQDIMNNKKH